MTDTVHKGAAGMDNKTEEKNVVVGSEAAAEAASTVSDKQDLSPASADSQTDNQPEKQESDDNATTNSKKHKPKKKKASRALSVIGIILCVLLTPILVLNIVLIVQGFSGDKSSMPNIGGYFPLMVQSGSMSPGIEVGDMIIVRTTGQPDKLREGDVVTYWDKAPGGTLVTHRIKKITKDDEGRLAYVTQGDANLIADKSLLSPSRVVGVYQYRIPLLGHAALFMQSIPGLIVCVLLPLVIFIVYDVLRRRRIEAADKEETAALLAELEELKKQQAEDNKTSR